VTNGVGLAVTPTGEVFIVEPGGKVKLYDPANGTTSVAATIPVFNQGEDGLLAIVIDPKSTTSQWVYLYYSPAGPNQVQHFAIHASRRPGSLTRATQIAEPALCASKEGRRPMREEIRPTAVVSPRIVARMQGGSIRNFSLSTIQSRRRLVELQQLLND
jgi:hypothetical protein